MEFEDLERMEKDHDFSGLQIARNHTDPAISKFAAEILCRHGFHEWDTVSETRSVTGDFYFQMKYRCSYCGETFTAGSDKDCDGD